MPSPVRRGGAAMDLGGEEQEEEAASLSGDAGNLPSSPRDGWEPVLALPSEEDHGRGWEMVAAGRGPHGYDDGCSVFPPGDHEGLHVDESFVAAPGGGTATGGGAGGSDPVPAVPSSPAFSSSSSSHACVSSSGGGGEAWRPGRHEGERRPLVELAMRAVRSGCELLHSTLPRPSVVREGFGGVKHGAVWSSAAVAGVAAILLLCVRRRYQRERLRLLLLIQQKDQKISQLLLQIAQMNEVLSTRRSVPVLRTA